MRAQVKGIPCTQFKYTSTSSDYDTQGHQLVGEAEEELPPSAGTDPHLRQDLAHAAARLSVEALQVHNRQP